MKLEPIITEKTTELAKAGKYTFCVDKRLTKFQARRLVEDVFGVHVKTIRTMNRKKEVKKTISGRKKIIPAIKKAIVTLGDKEKIDLFEIKKK